MKIYTLAMIAFMKGNNVNIHWSKIIFKKKMVTEYRLGIWYEINGKSFLLFLTIW